MSAPVDPLDPGAPVAFDPSIILDTFGETLAARGLGAPESGSGELVAWGDGSSAWLLE